MRVSAEIHTPRSTQGTCDGSSVPVDGGRLPALVKEEEQVVRYLSRGNLERVKLTLSTPADEQVPLPLVTL